MHGEIKKLLLSKKNIEEKYPESKNIASTKNLLPFFINERSHLRRNTLFV